MGASTALLLQHPLIIGRVCDSAFKSVQELCNAIGASIHLPQLFLSAAIWYLKKKVFAAANFDMNLVAPIEVVYEAPVPCVFGHAEMDQFIPFEHSLRLYEHYPSNQKSIRVLPGGHNSRRDDLWLHFTISFALDLFGIPVEDLEVCAARTLQESDAHFRNFQDLLEHASPIDDNSEGESFDNEEHEPVPPEES
jgi:hypothetical protein